MTPTELLAASRRWLNDETVATYKWTVAELIDYYNAAMDDLSRETDLFLDAYTEATVEIAVVAGTPDYSIPSNIIKLNTVNMTGRTSPLTFTTKRFLELTDSTWRYKASFVGTDISFTDGTPSADSIASVTTDFLDEGLVADDFIQITGSTSNDTTVQIDTATQHLLTLETTAALTTEVAGDTVLIRSLNADTPTHYLTDFRNNYITLYPCPDEAGRLFVETTRYQLTALTSSNYSTETIPIDSHYHLGFMNGILMYAYLKSGPSTFNIEKSNIHGGLFRQFKDKVKLDIARTRVPTSNLHAHDGAI